MSWLYFIQVGTSGPVKIGLTSQPKKRLSYLQVGNPEPLRLIGAWPGCDREEERELHDFLRGERLRGEWFRPRELLPASVWELADELDLRWYVEKHYKPRKAAVA